MLAKLGIQLETSGFFPQDAGYDYLIDHGMTVSNYNQAFDSSGPIMFQRLRQSIENYRVSSQASTNSSAYRAHRENNDAFSILGSNLRSNPSSKPTPPIRNTLTRSAGVHIPSTISVTNTNDRSFRRPNVPIPDPVINEALFDDSKAHTKAYGKALRDLTYSFARVSPPDYPGT